MQNLGQGQPLGLQTELHSPCTLGQCALGQAGVPPQDATPMQQPPAAAPAVAAAPTAPAAPSVPPVTPAMPEPPPPRPGSFDEYAAGLRLANIDVQRQTDALQYFTKVQQQLDALAADANAQVGDLPFIIFRYPTADDDKPGEYKLDLNSLPPEVLAEFRTVYQVLANEICGRFTEAWATSHEITAGANQLLRQMQAMQQQRL